MSFKKFYDDFKRKEFLPLKAIQLVSEAARFSIFPFLSIHARSIGITVSQYGVISILVPFLCLPIPALAGMLADKIGNFKWFLSATFFLNGIAGLLYLTVPKMEFRQTALVEFNCAVVDPLSITRESSSLYYYTENGDIVNQCNYDCALISETNFMINGSESICRIVKNCGPTTQADDNVLSQLQNIDIEIIEAEARIHNSTHYFVSVEDCEDNLKLRNMNNETIEEFECWQTCEGDLTAYNLTEEVISDYNIMVAYAFVRFLDMMLLASSFPLMIAAVVAILRIKDGDLAYQVMWGKVGTIIFSPLTGALIDYYSTDDYENYSPVFYVYFMLSIFASISLLLVDLKFKKPAESVVTEVLQVLKTAEAALLFIICVVLGMVAGVLENFLFWLLEDLGAEKSLMGLTVTVGAVSGLVLYFFATQIIERFGCSNCISFSIAIFAIRFYGYTVISNPWWAMPFEALECFTMTLLGFAVITNTSAISSVTTIATIQSIMLAALYGAGRGVGTLIGGFMIDAIGITYSFRVMSLVCVVTLILYTLISKQLIKKKITSLKNT